MRTQARNLALAMVGFALPSCATTPMKTAPAFEVQTVPSGAAVETTNGFRCSTPCKVPTSVSGLVATVTLAGYKPVQIPVTSGQKVGTVHIKLEPQDPGAGSPIPVGQKGK